MLLFALLIGCPKGPDSGDSGNVDALCAGEGATSLVLGSGSGSAFEPFTAGQEVALDVAPQGGFGVSVRALTTGLETGTISLQVDSLIDGELEGTFTIDAIQLYCQDDGAGLLWGAVVGFDPAVYSSNDDLLALDGELVTLEVTGTDARGVSVTGRSDVTVRVGS
jgi:hypothetical protein